MSSADVLKEGLGRYRELLDAGFDPYILGSAWLKLKLPIYDILMHDVDVYCPDLDPDRSPFPVQKREDMDMFATEDGRLEIIRSFPEAPGTRIGEQDLVRDGYPKMVSNSFWLASVLNKVANHLAKRYTELDLFRRYMAIMPLVNCYIFWKSGLEFDPKRVAWVLEPKSFTNTRILHIYNEEMATIAACIAERYYRLESIPDEIIMGFCRDIIAPIAKEMKVYDFDFKRGSNEK